MDNIRSGNLKVSNMKKEIVFFLGQLQQGEIDGRVRRQLADGKKFLAMIETDPYKDCKTVSKLKTKICDERNKLKDVLVVIDRFTPGHQFTMFELAEEISPKEQRLRERQKAKLEREIKWLHKCLGMCSNRAYFM